VGLGKLECDRIVDILTLRYSPHDECSFLPALHWEDFVEFEGIGAAVEPVLEGIVKRELSILRPRKVGIAISGGVDSTIVTAFLRKLDPELRLETLCVTFGEDTKEAPDAKMISEIYSTNHEEVNVANPISTLPLQISIVKEPRWNTYWYFVADNLRNRCDVLFTGDGGDELFGGYIFRYEKFTGSVQNNMSAVRKTQLYLDCHERDWVPDQENIFGERLQFSWDSILRKLECHFNNPLPLLGQVFLADYNGKLLHDYVPTNRSIYDWFKMKSVQPLLSKEMIAVATHIPYRLKYDSVNKVGKIVLRKILMDNFGYSASVKKKVGFGMDLLQIWHDEGREICKSILENARIVKEGYIREEWIDRTFNRLSNDPDHRYINKMFALLAFEVWYRLFVTHELSPHDKL